MLRYSTFVQLSAYEQSWKSLGHAIVSFLFLFPCESLSFVDSCYWFVYHLPAISFDFTGSRETGVWDVAADVLETRVSDLTNELKWAKRRRANEGLGCAEGVSLLAS